MLKTQHPTDYLKKEEVAEPIEEKQHTEQIKEFPKLKRYRRSDTHSSTGQQGLSLPGNFEIKSAIGGGDCFFDSVAKGLKQAKADEKFTIELLRELCHKYALENEWVKTAVVNDARLKSGIPSTIKDNDIWNAYLLGVRYTADDLEKMKGSNEQADKNLYRTLTSTDYGETLVAPIWGRPEIEGRVFCEKYNVKLHVVEKHNVGNKEVWADQVVDESGSKSVDSINYNEGNTIHIINKGHLHFEPVLNTQEIRHGKQITCDEELINVVRSNDSQEEKLEKIKDLLKNGANIDFKDANYENNTPLHIAVRKQELKVIELLVENKANIHIKNDRGITPLDIAEHLNKQNVVQLLKQQPTPLNQDSEPDKHSYQDSRELSEFLLLLSSKESFENEYRKLYSNEGEVIYYDEQKKRFYYSDSDQKTYMGSKDINFQKVKDLYLQTLTEIKKAVQVGNIDRIKNLGQLISRINEIERKNKIENTFLPEIFYNDNSNTVKNTNLIILACKYNQPEVIKYLFDDQTKVLDNLSTDVVRGAIQPRDIDGENHNAFYYAIRSGNVDILDALINKWPGKYFDNSVHSEELDNILAKAYQELKLKNVLLSDEIEIFVEGKLINLRFFHNPGKDKSAQTSTSSENIKKLTEKRMDLVLENIKSLKSEYSGTKGVDEKFLFISRFIAKNIRILKRQLKSTYNKLPWKEIEFCLVSFISSHVKHQEVNLFYNSVLNKEKLLNHLENFAENLEREKVDIEKVDIGSIGKLNELPKLNREKVVVDIIANYPLFEGLYNDYKQIRDVYSLEKISSYIELALLVNPKEKEGQLTVERALQVTGEYLKNTLDSPNLSSTTSKILLLELPKNTREIIMDLRDSLSHAYALSKRVEIEKNINPNFFANIQDDLKKVNIVINDIFHNKKLKMIRVLLKKISDSNNPDEIKEIADVLNSAQLDEVNLEKIKTKEHEKVEELIKELKNKINEKTNYEEELFNKINNIISSEKTELMNVKADYFLGFVFLKSLSMRFENNRIDDNSIRIIKTSTNDKLANIKPKIESKNLKEIAKLVVRIFNSAKPRIQDNNLNEIYELISKIFYIAEFETGQIKWIEEFGRKFDENKDSSNLVDKQEKLNDIVYKAYGALKEELELEEEKYNSLIREFENKRDEKFEYKKQFDDIKPKLISTLDQLIKEKDEEEKKMKSEKDEKDKEFRELVSKSGLKDDEKKKLNNYLKKKLNNYFGQTKLTQEKKNIENICNKISDKGIRSRIHDIFLEFIEKEEKILNEFKGLLDSLKLEDSVKILTDFENNSWDSGKKKIEKLTDNYGELLESLDHVNEKNIKRVSQLFSKFSELLSLSSEHKKILNESFKNEFEKEVQNKEEQAKNNKLKEEQNYNNQLDQRLSTLKSILNNKGLSDQLVEKFSFYKEDKKLQAVIEMLVLDIMAVLGDLEKQFEENRLFLDQLPSLLIGKQLRNYLAHGDALIDILLFDPSIAVISNAKKFAEEGVIKDNKKIGQPVEDDPSKLKNQYNQNLVTITNQENMFAAVEDGNLESLKSCIKKGADINARSINLWTALHFAAKGSSLEVVKFLLDQNLNVNVKDVDGQNPLHIAVSFGNEKIIKFFIEDKGTDVNCFDNQKKTPLHIAAQNGYKNVVELLLKNNANTSIKDISGLAPLHYAVRNDHKDVVKVLLEKEANVDINETMGGFTSLHEAAEYGYLELVNFLLQNKANVNAKNDRDWIPLHAAALNGHLEVVKTLILNGANVNAKVINSCTPLHYAAETGHEEIVKILLDNGADVNTKESNFTPLHFAAQYNNRPDVVKLFLERGADINAKGTDKMTPIHFAVQYNRKEIVKVLIEKGANINAELSGGATLLHLAALNGNKEIIKILITEGANVNAKNKDNFTPLHTAALNGNKEVVDLLIKNKAEVNARDITPLHVAALSGNKEVVDLLIKNKAEVNARDITGSTPLHVAALNGNKEVVDLLIKNKAEVNARDITGSIPLHAAIETGDKEVVEILIANGADIDARSNNNLTPLSSAVKHNYKEIVEVLIAKGANVNAENGEPLSLAVFAGYRDIVEILLKNKARVNTKASDGSTLLHLAAKRDHKEIVNALIAKGADVNAITINSATPLYFAAQEGHKEIAEVLITKGANINIKDNKNRTPIELAVANGHLQVVKTLLQHKEVNVNAKGNDNWTVLHIAAQEGNLEIAKYLIDKGSNINAKNTFGSKPIHIAAREGNKNIVEFFLNNGFSINCIGAADQTLLHYAAMKGHLEVVKYLIAQGADVNAKDAHGSSPMHIAANFGYKDVMEVLLNNGAIYNAVDNFDRTPLEVAKNSDIINSLTLTKELFKAVKHDDHLEVESLIRKGAFINAKNTDGGTPLHYASWKGFEKIIKILLQNKANPNAAGKGGWTPLHYATKFTHLEIIKALLSSGAIYNAMADNGKTPLDFATRQDIIDLLKLVSESFKNVQNGNSRVINNLKKVKDTDTIKAIMNARDRESKTLIVAAIHNDFPKTEQLKQISQDDVSTEINVALVLFTQGNYQEALSIFKSVFEKRKEILGPDNPGTLDIQKYIAGILYKQGKYQEALKAHQEIYQKQKEILGLNNKDTLDTRGKIALVLHRQGKNEEAFDIYREVYQKQKEILGADHSDTLNTQLHMALVLDKQGKYEEALNINQEVFKKSKRILGAYNPHTLSAQNNIAMVLNSQGKHKEALKAYKEVFEKKKLVLGVNHPDTLRTLCNIGGVLLQDKKYSEALETFREVFEIQKTILGSHHPDTLHTQYNMANLLFLQGKFIKALKEYKESFEKGKVVLGPSHPIILDTLKKIEIINLRFKLEGKEASNVLQNIYKGDTENLTLLNIAASNGDKNTVEDLLKNGYDINTYDNIGHRTPLHFASESGHSNIVDILLQNRANIEAVDINGSTPLHYAAHNNHKEVVKALLGKGANVNAVDSHNKKPVDYTTDDSIKDILRSTNELFTAITTNDLQKVENLVQKGGVINAIGDSNRLTPLHHAVHSGNIILVKFLLDKEAIVNSPDKDGWMPLHYAAQRGQKDIVEALLEKGSDVDVKDNIGRTPVYLAAKGWNKEIVAILLRHIQHGIQSYKEQQKAFSQLSKLVSHNIPHVQIQSVKQGLYLSSFESRNVQMDGKCAAITRAFSQVLSLGQQGKLNKQDKVLLSNLQTSAELYERLAQGKQISTREERETFALSNLLDNFEQQLDSSTSSLPSSLSHIKSYKQSDDLLRYVSDLTGDFAIHLVTSNHVVAIYRVDDNYAYFDSNVAFVYGLKNIHQLMKVLEKAVVFAGYELLDEGFLVEQFDVTKANNALTAKQKEVLTKPIQTERYLLSLQDQRLGYINLNGKQVSRVTLYDLGTKLHLEGSAPILINSDMNLSNENLLAYLNAGKISITAREYLENLRGRVTEVEKMQELTQATKVIPFAGSRNEIKHAQQIQELLSSDAGSKLKNYELSNLLKSPIEKSIKALPYYLEVAKTKHWPDRLTNAAGRIQLIRGIHGATVSCDRERGNVEDCLLNTGEISLSLVSQLIEDKVVKNVPKLIKSLKTVKFGTHILRGGAAIISSPFDIYDIVDSAIDLHNCEKGSSECKDAIAGVTFASTSLASGVVLTAIGAPGIGTAVGLVIMIAQGAYGGGRAIEEFQPYRLTFDENFRLFWHAFALQPVPTDVEYIKARKDIVSQITKQVWEQLQNRSEVAHVTGLGDVTFKEERECKPVQEGLDRYQSCTHRKVRVPTLFPSNATILMDLSSIKGNDYQRFLSRVLPDSPSQDAVMLCLPAFSGKDYERDYTLSNGYPKYESSPTVTSYCGNAMMIGDKHRIDQVRNKRVVFDLNLVNQGVVVGSDKWQNDFIIYKGKTKVLGGENTRNTFILTSDSFTGTIFGGKNSTNILDVSNLSSSNLYIDNLSPFDRTSYVQDYTTNKKQLEERTNRQAHFYGISNLVISANTTVAGNGDRYIFYIKPNSGYSKINVAKGSVVFPETALLLDCNSFTYSPESNVLSMKFGNFTLDIGNYFNRDKKICNFELIDKYGSSIGPLVDLEQSNSQEVKLFNLRTETALTYNNVTKWYEGIAKANKEYQVYGTVKVKYPIAQEKYGSYPNMIFGTSGSDIIPVTKETWYTEGREGSDSYNVMPSNSSIVTEVNNYAEDGIFDLLYMPVNSIQASKDGNNLHLYPANSTHSVKVKDYFVNSSYQHLTVIDENKDVFVPLVNLNHQSNVQLVPFYHATKDQYMFSLSAEKIRNNSEIIVDAKLDNMKFYRDGSNLVLIDDKPIMVKLEGFYDKDKSLQNLTINFWHDHHKDKLDSQQLLELSKLAINYQDEIRNTYYDSVKEYIVPTSNATIHHNQELTNGTLATVEPSSKRVGVLVLQDDVEPSGIEVSVNNEDLVFFVGQNNATFTIKNWNDTDHRVSTLRFNQAKEIRGLDKFDLSQVSEIQSLVNKAALNGIASQQLEKLDTNVVNGIKYLLAVRGIENGVSAYKCLGFDSEIEEWQFISAYHSHYNSEKLSRVLNHGQGVEALVWLVVKGYSNLSLENHSIDRRSLLNNLDKCFSATINKRTINRIMRKLEVEDVETVIPNVESFIKHHKEALENRIVNSLRNNTTEIDTEEGNHQRKRRDVRVVKDYKDYVFFNAQSNANSSLKGQQVTSGGNKLSSWINTFVAATVVGISKLGDFIFPSSKASLSTSANTENSIPRHKSEKARKPGDQYIAQFSSDVCVQNNVHLVLLLLQNFLDKRYPLSKAHSVTFEEAQSYAINITTGFEQVLNNTAIKSGISVANLSFNPVTVQSAIARYMRSGKCSEVLKTLYSSAKEACPEFKQTDRFLSCLAAHLKAETSCINNKPGALDDQSDVRKMPLSEAVAQIERRTTVEISNKPRTCLNNIMIDNSNAKLWGVFYKPYASS